MGTVSEVGHRRFIIGYTHYHFQDRDLTEVEWQHIKIAFQIMLDNLPPHSHNAGGYYSTYPLELRGPDGAGEPLVEEMRIMFNGDRSIPVGGTKLGLMHEDFALTQFPDIAYSCTKTERKPYDLCVCVMLLIVKSIAPDAYIISSDGERYEWTQARQLAGVVLRKMGLKLTDSIKYFVPRV